MHDLCTQALHVRIPIIPLLAQPLGDQADLPAISSVALMGRSMSRAEGRGQFLMVWVGDVLLRYLLVRWTVLVDSCQRRIALLRIPNLSFPHYWRRLDLACHRRFSYFTLIVVGR